MRFLVLPGIYSSGPEHWQTRWENSDSRFRRVEQDDWEHPRPADWVPRIEAAVEESPEPVVIVAHSLGCHATAYASRQRVVAERVVAALLVAPPDLDDPRNEAFDMGPFRPMRLDPLPFPSLVAASTDDHTCRAERAAQFAAAWGSDLVLLEGLGHINSESGLGDWPHGRQLLSRLIERATDAHDRKDRMEIRPKQPTTKAPAETFTGDAWLDEIVRGEEPSRVRVSLVRFAPGARNAWHAHALGQTLHITDGVGRMGARGSEVMEVRAGETIYTPPGEWHWHGAAPQHFMTHLAIWEAPAEGAETDWGAQVSDAEYHGRE